MCWGSFLNVLAYRLVKNDESLDIWQRSRCPHCHHQLPWYDLLPVLSFVYLGGQCRFCKQPISYLYPFVEVLTTIVMVLLFQQVPLPYSLSYFIFFSALIVTIRSDLETMLISRFVSLYLMPLGWLLSTLNFLPITLLNSFMGAATGYIFLWIMARLFKYITGQIGLGQGDIELLGFIGSFTGIQGAWISLLLGSLSGSVIGIAYIIITRQQHSTKIPFGPFLAAGAIVYVLYTEWFAPYISAITTLTSW